ncbi:tetratricopeptide repeat protein 17 isoform X2 [Phymastichus coffea]|uniref:tetratricopeptide repeat protein 17 isoform X2 n=1 Tax=Phymastichus coffea TaxID=108790 RepID=UPI00273CCBE3|nr:tetratricopeptide repeat protein 17 isoform X2 [Phymastichus coffea]
MKMSLIPYIFFFVLFELLLEIWAATHWVVTENVRIQSMPDSIFQMRRPNDLLSFLEQGNRLDSVNKLFESIKTRKTLIDNQFVGLHSASDIENGLHMTDIDCLSREQYNVGLDFDQTVVINGNTRDGITDKDFGFDDIPMDDGIRIPDCRKTFPLDFSMHTFEHLTAMQNRKKLKQAQEKNLIKFTPLNLDLNSLGHNLAYKLHQNSTSWLHLNLASIYWRIKGVTYNALECARRAIVKAPRRYRDIPLLTTGGILYAANQSADAAIILQTAIEYAPTVSLHHFALANVYAHLGQYNKSVKYYDNVLRLDPSMNIARSAKHNILCNLKLESSLSALHQQLLDILTELRTYHNEQTELLSFQEKMLWDDIKQMPFLTSQNGIHDESLNSLLNSRGQSCMQRGEDESVLSCDITSERQMLAQKLQIDFGVSLQVLKNVENQAKEIRERMTKTKITTENLDHLSQTPDYSKFSSVFMEPTGRPKYHNLEIKPSNENFEKPDWPTESFCESLIPFVLDVKQYVPVYLPPENKGYVTYLFVSELIGIEPDKEHPVPWYPPVCQVQKIFNRKYIPPELVKATTGYNLPDSSLTPLLTALVENRVEDAEISEIGQRILTATNSKVAAPWVLSMLASLHWRVIGKPRNALDCLQLALDTVPNKFRDVPLISIASISHKFSLVDNALSVTEEAFKINSVEPMTNFLYGTLLHIKGNYSGAIHHLKQTLRVEPHAMDGRAITMLQTIACQERFSTTRPGQYTNFF